MDADLDAKGEWVPPRSRIEERQRVIRDLKVGYVIVPKVVVEVVRQAMADLEIMTTKPVARALRQITDELGRKDDDGN